VNAGFFLPPSPFEGGEKNRKREPPARFSGARVVVFNHYPLPEIMLPQNSGPLPQGEGGVSGDVSRQGAPFQCHHESSRMMKSSFPTVSARKHCTERFSGCHPL